MHGTPGRIFERSVVEVSRCCGGECLVNLIGRVVYVVGDWGRGLQTGRLRNYLMFLAVALVGLFVGVFAWIRA